MKREVVIILGASGSGKDHRKNVTYPNYKHIDVIRPWRNWLEDTLGFERGELSTQEGKQKLFPGSNITMGEYMVGMYKSHRELRTIIAVPMLEQELETWLKSDLEPHAVITSVRTVDEAEAAMKFINENELDIRVEVLYNRGKLKESDLSIVNILGYFDHKAFICPEFIDTSD